MEDESRKRKASTDPDPPKKRTRRVTSKGKGKADSPEKPPWPQFFQDLFKTYKALNTVLAFCSSRKHLATTFPVIRSSVESLLKRPLKLSEVAEIKALLPDLVNFAYIPSNQLKVNEDGMSVSSKKRGNSPDFSLGLTAAQAADKQVEHVLVLDFRQAKSKRPSMGSNPGLSLLPSLTPAAVKKLIDQRNSCFSTAVDEVLQACSGGEDPATLIQIAARDHLPVDPSSRPALLPEATPLVAEGRPPIESVLELIKNEDWYKDQIVERRVFGEKEAQRGTVHPPLSPQISQAIKSTRGIDSLYTHQATAIGAIRQGRHVILSTSTASGKSVIYQIPLLGFLEEDKNATALFIYPTKALAQDQKAALEQLLAACPDLKNIKVATYDGDTPQDQRPLIRDSASVIFTNFDMLHASILPHEDTWRRFLRNLKLVAVDELHYYHSVLGSHVAFIMRRFRRVCTALGNRRIVFISCSATVSQPKKHMESIFGITDIEVITEDGAPSGKKEFLIWNPPLVDERHPKLGRTSSLSETTALMRFLMKRGVRTIVFCKIRKVCELVMKTIRAELSADGRLDILDRVMAYRGGYSNEDRRRIEREAFGGHLLGIIATNALELGVDIGTLDAVIMLGFPYSIASLRQQAGRCGRRAKDSLAIMVADSVPIDQHYVHHPEELFTKPVEDLTIDLTSKVMIEAHLQCAANEMPINTNEDESYFGPSLKSICETRLNRDQDGWYHTHTKFLPFPSKYISIRGIQEERYSIVDITGTAKILEEIEDSRAIFEAYEGAVFMHQGLTFVVQEVSHDTKMAKIIRADVNWITSPRDFTNVDPSQIERIREIKGSPHRAFYGRVDVQTVVYGFFKIRNKQILDTVDLESPPFQRDTTGLWVDIPKPILQLMRGKGINPAEAIHSASHAILSQFPMSGDLKTECKAAEKEYRKKDSKRKRPARLVFYDSAGRYGIVSAKAFDNVSELVHRASAAVNDCTCETGCSECIHSALCKEKNAVASKIGAKLVLDAILGREVDPESIPSHETVELPPETIVDADLVRSLPGVQLELS